MNTKVKDFPTGAPESIEVNGARYVGFYNEESSTISDAVRTGSLKTWIESFVNGKAVEVELSKDSEFTITSMNDEDLIDFARMKALYKLACDSTLQRLVAKRFEELLGK
ncbi:MAG: hypothetical protein KAS32_17990 [Candidatus Peribacteraceae bacterium]|nr:hypothetical protein [Candidatus Peribacteraceae bacterium]